MPICRASRSALLQHGAAFADGDDVVFGAVERHQLAEPPDAGEIEPALRRRCPWWPSGARKSSRLLRDGQARPVVRDVEQAAALRAGDVDFVDAVGRRAVRVDALLKGRLGHALKLAWARRPRHPITYGGD